MKKQIIINLSISIVIGIIFSIIAIKGSYAATTYAINSNNVVYTDNSSLGVTNVQAAIDGTCTKFNSQLTALKQEVISEMYPKGSIYISTELSTKAAVAEKLGGTWEPYGTGKVLKGTTGTAGTTGGSNTVKLTTANLPSHTHTIPSLSGSTKEGEGSHSHTIENGSRVLRWNDSTLDNLGYIDGDSIYGDYTLSIQNSGAHTHTLTTKESTTTTCNNCSSTALSVEDSYITVYMYRRIA